MNAERLTDRYTDRVINKTDQETHRKTDSRTGNSNTYRQIHITSIQDNGFKEIIDPSQRRTACSHTNHRSGTAN